MESHIQHISIIGGGKMGSSLFHYLSDLGYKLVWILRSDIEKKQKKYHRKLARALKNDLISHDEFDFRMNHHQISGSLQDLEHVDLVIECIREELVAKRELIAELIQVLKPEALIASNSSSILPEKMVDRNELLHRVFGLHFFFPLETKDMVEVIQSSRISSSDQQQIEHFLSELGKSILIQEKEDAFLLNRILLRFQALVFNYSQEQGYGFNLIDVVSSKYLFPMGIFEMMDYIGLDLIHKSAGYYMENQSDQFVYQPILYFMNMQISQGYIGLSVNQGIHNYSKTAKDIKLEEQDEIGISNQLVKLFQNAFHWALEISTCSKEELVIGLNDYLDTDINEWINE